MTAHAVVSGELDEGSVYAGNPAKRICSIEQYYKKRKDKQLSEAIEIYHRYIQRFGTKPSMEIFHEYFFLFSGGNDIHKLPDNIIRKFSDNGNQEESVTAYMKNKPLFISFEEFCSYAEKNK